jgi:hypothetical protein
VYGGRTARFVRQLTALQDELGLMQDAEVASVRLTDLATGETHLPPATVFVMGGVAERHRREVNRLIRRLPRALPRVSGREWSDLLDLMERRRAQAEAALPPVRSTLRAVPQPGPEAPNAPQSSTSPAPASVVPSHPAAPPGLTALAPPPQSGQRE